MKKDLFKVRLSSFAGLLCFMLTLASCANEEVVQKATNTNNDKNLTSFIAGVPETRTSLDYNSGAFYWEAGDYIYVQDDDNVWQKSSNAPTNKTTSFMFRVPGKFTNNTTYKVYYPGKNGNENQVTIPTTQTQTEPNSTIHFGESGDCGTATAVKNRSATGEIGFRFSIDHQASYLVFQPYTNNTSLQNSYLTKIEVSSDDDIADTYTLDPVTGLTGMGTGKKIVLTTQGNGVYANGFPLNTSSANVAINGAYMVIKPGTHTLKVRYRLKNKVTGAERTIIRILSSFTYNKNTYYDLITNLDVNEYSGDHYYMWDAKKQFWYGYEWTKNLPAGQGQPTIENLYCNYPPDDESDPRFFNSRTDITEATTPLFQKLPNANEMAWYVEKGDAHWDNSTSFKIFNRISTGGIWLKKLDVIAREQGKTREELKAKAPDGSDWRISNPGKRVTPKLGKPDDDVIGNYFFLPAQGCYISGYITFLNQGYYWSSTAIRGYDSSYYLSFSNDNVEVSYDYSRKRGFIAQPFSDFGEDE